MGDVLLLLLLVAGAAGAWWWWQRRRTRQLAAAHSLDQAALVLGGQVQHSTRDPARGCVLFEDAGQRFRLYREHRAAPGLDQAQCVVEAEAGYAGPELVLVSSAQGKPSLPSPQRAWPLPWPDLAERGVALAATDPSPALQVLLADAGLRTLLRHALDHRGARVRLSPRGSWFECEGFSDNGELVAATARTAARALAGLLGRPVDTAT